MFGNNSAEINHLKVRVAALEQALAQQQDIIAKLAGGASIPASLIPKRTTLHPEVLALLQEGKKISAIKRHRELTGAGLKEAKEAVEAL
ncbi:ribosomal protein L7/L12 [Corynebacterium crudilactis]|uniref:50S ribosomal protein L7/L12 n=1 Tax=Corynebacterium crudilactis TaxID=1652495 RepID=A0A172QX04_9CORY|nr:ribosomal protein L7/L12 [Corynebacterium crudilactis]ANE05239.1 50S ribosomal protein L7/L12 [Corynebacterium crudilactis]